MLDKVIVIAGPTASGKTDLAIELALRVGGEIISADSMQIYREMNVGTAKPTDEEKRGIPHHMMDIVYPDEEYSVAQFQRDAKSLIKQILSRNKIPIVAGGTGLYVNALVYNIAFSDTTTQWEYRECLQKLAEEEGPEALHKLLQKVDEKSAASIHPNNVKRVIRALEVFETTGKPISEHQKESRREPPAFDFRIYGLDVERSVLYERIERRVDRMLASGLCQEVEGLLKKGYSPDLVSLQGIGYKEIISAIQGHCSLSEAVDRIKLATRHLAKKQMTWFRKTEGLKWMKTSDSNTWAMLKILEDALNVQN